jgi:hypothetical protein
MMYREKDKQTEKNLRFTCPENCSPPHFAGNLSRMHYAGEDPVEVFNCLCMQYDSVRVVPMLFRTSSLDL